MEYRRMEAKLKRKEARKLRADWTGTLDIIKRFLGQDLARFLGDKVVTAVSDERPRCVPSLVDLCAARVASDKNSVDTLYAIYGPDANLPLPAWVMPKVEKLSRVYDLDSICKLALLLSNNASAYLAVSICEDEVQESEFLGHLVWKKVSSVCKKLQHLEVDYDDENYCPDFCRTEVLVAFVRQLSNLRVFKVPYTVLLDTDLQVLGASLPQLKRLEFKYNGQITEMGVQALGQLKKLEKLLFSPCGTVALRIGQFCVILYKFITRCLATIPWLKVLCSCIKEDYSFYHTLPYLEKQIVLSLEHLRVRGSIKYGEESSPTKSCSPLLSNVRFLKIFEVDNDIELITHLERLQMNKLEELYVQGCYVQPARALLRAFGSSLSVLELDECNGAFNVLRILEGVPVAKGVSIDVGMEGKGHYTFDDHAPLQQVSPNLKTLFISLNNNDDWELPDGVFTRLLALPKLEVLRIYDVFIRPEECRQAALKINSGALNLQNLTTFAYHGGWREGADSPLLLAAMCANCPKLEKFDCEGEIKSNSLVSVLSALFYPKIKINF